MRKLERHDPLKTHRVPPALDFIAKASLGHSARPSTTMATDNMHSKEEKRRKNKQATTGCHKEHISILRVPLATLLVVYWVYF